MPIALLKFPYDLLGEVFKQCNPIELYCLSKCSKRTRNSVKSGGKINWKISYWSSEKIMICGNGLDYVFKATEKQEDYFKIESYQGYKSMQIPMEGVVEMFFYLLDTLRICIVQTLGLQFDKHFDNFSKVAKVLMERNLEIERLSIGFIDDVQDLANFMPLISQMRITKEFAFAPMFPADFHYQLINYPRYIHIIYACRFDTNQLLNCTCSRIKLRNSTLSNQDLNIFFRQWKTAGTFPNLQWLEIDSKKIDNQFAILDMVPPITRVENPQKQVSIRFGDGQNDEVMIFDAVRVYKDDGTEAWLKVKLGDVPELEFLVCNPDNTKVEEIEWSDDDDDHGGVRVPIEEYENRAWDDEEIDGEDSDEEESDEEESDEEESDDDETDYEESSDEN
ncbi:hypothetical protein B9Z55_003705 [Caenorhabditis nigoni]|nr:hypothetical protein B9Z55_003705 [Caenorhabditis nigoni]